jgi:hypothetical protein
MSTAIPRAPLVSNPDHARTTSARVSEHRFYFSAALIAAVIVLVGFSRTYFLKEVFHAPTLLPIVHLHAIIFSSWVVLFITQTWLVSVRNTRLHMRLGIAGFLLACIMVVVGTTTALTVAKLGHVRPGGPPPLQFLVVPIFDMLVFSILIAAGLLMRRRSDYHKRFLLVATASLMTAAIGRIVTIAQGHANVKLAFAFTSSLIVIAAVVDTIRNRRLHPAFAWAGALVLLSGPVRFMLAGTSVWMSFARWVTS